jgi:hypothetical protein
MSLSENHLITMHGRCGKGLSDHGHSCKHSYQGAK